MIRHKINQIAKSTNRTYDSAKRRVKVLAPAMSGNTPRERIDQACEKILEKIARDRVVFRNVDFRKLYKDIL